VDLLIPLSGDASAAIDSSRLASDSESLVPGGTLIAQRCRIELVPGPEVTRPTKMIGKMIGPLIMPRTTATDPAPQFWLRQPS
jgi:hypothetical protein